MYKFPSIQHQSFKKITQGNNTVKFLHGDHQNERQVVFIYRSPSIQHYFQLGESHKITILSNLYIEFIKMIDRWSLYTGSLQLNILFQLWRITQGNYTAKPVYKTTKMSLYRWVFMYRFSSMQHYNFNGAITQDE